MVLAFTATLAGACAKSPPALPDAPPVPAAWLRFRLDPGAPALAQAIAISLPFTTGCGLDPKQLRTLEGTIARPARIVVDAHGGITKDVATCLLSKVLPAELAPTVSAIADGVRVELALAPGDAPAVAGVAPPPLLPGAIAASTVFGAGAAAWTVQLSADVETRVVLVAPTEDAAKATEAWLVASIADAPALKDLHHTRDGRTLTVSAPSEPMLAGAVRAHLLEAFKIPSASMAPTIVVGDMVLVAKGAAVRSIAKDDLVVYRRGEHPPYVKRVVALAGETVDDGTVVPAGHVWVLGDDRENSMDSRTEGPLPVSAIFGKPFALYWSTEPARIGALL